MARTPGIVALPILREHSNSPNDLAEHRSSSLFDADSVCYRAVSPLAEPFDYDYILRPAKAAVLFPVLHDPPRNYFAYSRQRGKLLCVR
jgi:hypothetical protein